ncbi:N-6 DNA methylase [Xanthomonas sacchari]|uniref:restriction endonuclease subunit M n=1 Tax=Xanthomonas sacchari TaxID=56458 RepID=UPI00225E4E89|nr:N-6 DNA methylase [Xanthomonas sacchari]UYK81347.1 N-6 DNA methylase [Xanthomonas sacchari]
MSPRIPKKNQQMLTTEQVSTSVELAPTESKEAEDSRYVKDYISGQSVRATPEEIEAVQVFSQRLVEDFGYPKKHITTRPQFRVRRRPSDETRARGYPVDIAVFSNSKKLEDEVFIVVECKRTSRKDGEKQLKLYLGLSSASIGVWFNGEDHIYLYKNLQANGTVEWVYLPTLPKYGQSLEDIGSLTREQLTLPSNLKSIFRDIRNHLAGNTTGITRDQELAQEIMAVLFCKIFDELDKAPDETVDFRASVKDKPAIVQKRISSIFERVKREYPDVFRASDSIALDADSMKYVVGELQNYAVSEADRDVVGEAFEVFIGPAVRGEEGQFFTPRNVVQAVVQIMDPKPGETVLDPSCGSGGFLIVALEHVWSKLEAEATRKKWSEAILLKKKREVAMRCFRGIDKDAFLTRVTKAYMAIIGDGRGGIFCEDSLDEPKNWRADAQEGAQLEMFDCILTNPPFGSKIKVSGSNKLGQYELARKWKLGRDEDSDWEPSDAYHTDQPPQVLFIERCTQFLKKGGRMAIVLPESIFGMPVYGYVVKWLYENYRIRAFISLPEEVFQPSTHAKTCVVILENTPPSENDVIEMAIADWCGHDSRGNPTLRVQKDGSVALLDDLPKIAEQMTKRVKW